MSKKTSKYAGQLAASFLSVIIFMLMYILSGNGSRNAYRHFMKGTIGNTGRWMNTYGPEWFVDINKNISALGGPAVFALITAFVFILLIIAKEKKLLLEFSITITGTIILMFILKYLLNASRPADITKFIFNDDLGFPSGHAMSSLVLYSSLAVYASRKAAGAPARLTLMAIAVVTVILIGVSRLVVGAHTPEEVIAGWCAGIFWISLINFFFSRPGTAQQVSLQIDE